MSTMRWSRHSPPDGADHALGDRVRLRSANRRQNRRDPDRGGLGDEVAAGSPIAVADQEAGMRIPRRGRQDLPPHPRGVGMPGDVPVHNAAAIVADHEKDVAGLQGERLDGEEVRRPDVRRVQAEEGPPGGRGGWYPTIAIHRGSTYRVSQDAELCRDAADAPHRILRRQPQDALSSREVNRGPAGPGARLFQRQYRRQASRCQPTTVAGCTIRRWRATRSTPAP